MVYSFIESPSTNLVKYHLAFDINEFKNEYVAFSGALGKHPSDPNKVILILDFDINNASYYEFNSADIGLIEKLPNIINSDGEDIVMALLWIKKGSFAIRSSVLIV